MGNNEVHVRAAEVAAQLAVSIPNDGTVQVRTFHSADGQGIGHRVPVVKTSWTATDVSAPTLVVKLANGQEFELEVRHSSHDMRLARMAVEHPASAAERAQDEAHATVATARRARHACTVGGRARR